MNNHELIIKHARPIPIYRYNDNLKELRHERQIPRPSIQHLMHSDGWAYFNLLKLFVEMELGA
jgi:hypothetical protein